MEHIASVYNSRGPRRVYKEWQSELQAEYEEDGKKGKQDKERLQTNCS